ncbi:hypothetical protein [Sphingomonas cavernae]|uniref:DUF2157 domain-containing protein n=1 Tax=Sphingomonas cavernae TaxID=2320861 RepID=A0A418W6B5_9SPHN|nr:hypothetical protein [Sphingomonas cavernae]RJF85570.1 hypothetical protein D3876_16745 [Sphingomonas cavernae]
MYSESDLEGAVAAGALTPAAADAFRNHIANCRATSLVDEESFRLLTGFNDIFVAIAIALLLTALAWIGGDTSPGLGGALVAGASWLLAEYFTKKRRMALPSIVLLLTFTGGVAAAMVGTMVDLDPQFSDRTNALLLAGFGVVTATAAWAHWRRFHVPITVAAGAVALVGVLVSLVLAIDTGLQDQVPWFVLAGGIALFAAAMWWDMSDRTRHTRRADVAFWLHLAAAPMIAHPIFHQLGLLDGYVGTGQAAIVIALYIFFAAVSLAVDRRALLVSSLAYVLYAMSALFERFGAVSLGVAFTALIIGSALLMLSAFWHPVRRMVVGTLPGGWRDKLPVSDRPAPLARPA